MTVWPYAAKHTLIVMLKQPHSSNKHRNQGNSDSRQDSLLHKATFGLLCQFMQMLFIPCNTYESCMNHAGIYRAWNMTAVLDCGIFIKNIVSEEGKKAAFTGAKDELLKCTQQCK